MRRTPGLATRQRTAAMEAAMSKLTSVGREDLPKRKIALPDERKYLAGDKAHARNAKAYAAQQEKAGKLSAADR